MSLLKTLEREFVLGDARVFNEYDNSNFISNSKTVLTNTAQPVNLNLNNFGYYTSMIEKAIQNFSIITLDKELIQEFLMKFENISKLDSNNIMVRDISYSDVGPFKPQYLSQYVSMVQIAIDKAMRGEITEGEIVRYVSGEIPEKIERQIVKSPLATGVRPKDLIIVDDVKRVKADTLFVKTKVIPFVSRYDVLKNETLVEANSVLNAIRESEETLKAMNIAIEKIKRESSLDMTKLQLLNQVSYNAIRGIMEVVSYISYMLIRKINSVSSNIMACNQLYIDISNMYAGTTTLESAFDQNIMPTDILSLAENLLEGRSDAFDTLAEHIYNFHGMLPDANNITDPVDTGYVNNEIGQQSYDNTPYENICKAYIEISVGLDVMGKEGDEFLMVYDDIIKQSGFGIILEERFQNEINALKVVSDGYSDLRRLLAEVKDYPNNMSKLAKIIAETYEKMTYLMKRFSDNTNGEYSDTETINELKIFLGQLEEQYKEMTKKVADSCFERIKNLGVRISAVKEMNQPKQEINTVDIETSSNLDFTEAFIDFTDLAFEIELQDYEESQSEYFETLQCAYFAEKARIQRGVNVVFEADTTPSTTTTQPATQQNNTAPTTTTNNTNTANKPANNTKVSVQDNSGEGKGGIGKVFAKSASFFRNIIDRFLEFINKSATKNAKWLSENKDNLSNRSYSNVTLNILPYSNMKYTTSVDDIGKLKGICGNAANVSTMLKGSSSKDELYTKIFPFINGGIKEANGALADQFRKYYMVGSTSGELQIKPVSNGELKELVVNELIPYCEAYLGDFKNNVANSINDLVGTINSLGKNIDQQNTTTTTESAIFTEADDANNTNNDKPAADNATKSRWFANAINVYTGSLLNALKQRNTDYLKALVSLTPKNPVTPQQPTHSNTENNTDNNANANAEANQNNA